MHGLSHRSMTSPFPWLLILAASASTGDPRVAGSKSLRNEQNIGTVLFERNDCAKRCWTSEEFAVLNSRRMFQDLLPQAKVINSQNDRYIAHLMDYFHICLESVRKLSIGKTKHLMLKALADTMGGYLQVYILPLTRHSYYAGNVKYRNARRLFELYDELRSFLRTNGVGWTRPDRETGRARTPPLVITPSKSSVACNGLITYSAPAGRYEKRHVHRLVGTKRKRHLPRRRRARNALGHGVEKRSDEGSVIVPLPFLDNEAEPNSIALPFKADSLQSLYCEKSAFALVKYYVASVKCIESTSKASTELESFNKDFFAWLQQSVYRHLEDEKWYPAFGGVLRIIASLEEYGMGGHANEKNGGTYQVMPNVGTEQTSKPEGGAPPLYAGTQQTQDNALTFGTTELIAIAIVSALLVWLLVGLSLVCYRFLTRHSEECPPCDSPDTPVAVLYENADYCRPDTCHSDRASKGMFDRLNEWWRNKFGRCPGGCRDKRNDEERCLASISYTSKDTVPVSNNGKTYQRRKRAKSLSASPSVSPGDRASFSVCYSSDVSSTNTDSPGKTR